jgi:two-component system response regulator HydG
MTEPEAPPPDQPHEHDDAPASGPEAIADPGAVTICVVDDDASNLASLETIFKREGMRVFSASGGKRALEICRKHRVQVVVTDLMMPGTSGLELLKALKTVSPETEVVLMTAYGTVETAVSAMKEGAFDFVEKPLKRAAIVKSVRLAASHQKLVAENRALKKKIELLEHREIVGTSPALRKVLEVVTQAAPSTATVLVLGESGTGKELLARYLHERSTRAAGPFVAVNCAAIPEAILEAELFGHEKGSFTGAVARRDGRFSRAAGGTLFLDEIGELSPQVQVKLLRVLQEGEYEPIGGDTRKADVRIVAATNRDLKREVAEGRFREDLFYRLNVIAVTAPPLRARREDVPLLVDHFLGVYSAKNGRARLGISKPALARLVDYGWPGNVRELENVIERAVVLCRGDALGPDDLPEHIVQGDGREVAGTMTFSVGTPIEQIELVAIKETLRQVRGDKALAAQLLGISIRTIYRKLGENDE